MAAASLLTACWLFQPPSADTGHIIFPHAQHVEMAECETCHVGVAKDEGNKPAGAFIPSGHEGCEDCHDVSSGCETCHRGPREGARFAREERRLRFAHATHAKVVESCKTCHPPAKQGGTHIAGHDTCNTSACHKTAYSTLGCQTCHQDLQRYPLAPVADLTHGPNFERTHGPVARQSVRACAACHDQTYCADCHAGNTAVAKPSLLFPEDIERGFIHRGDFVGRHAIEARAAPYTCRKCHGQRYCRACHALNGVAVAPHPDLEGGRSRAYHPPGWMTPGGGRFHGHQARRNIARCATCHDQGASSNCVGCHRVGGIGGNPHPADWSWQDKRSDCQQNPMCRSCHSAGQGCL